MKRKTLSDKGVAALKPRAKPYAEPDPELTGHYIRVQPTGARSYVAVARSPAGKQIWTTIGAAEVLPAAEARIRARETLSHFVADAVQAVVPISCGFLDFCRFYRFCRAPLGYKHVSHGLPLCSRMVRKTSRTVKRRFPGPFL
jgi:hypothetical protein